VTRADRRRADRAARTRSGANERPRAARTDERRPAWQSPVVIVSALAVIAAAVLIVVLNRPATAPADFINPPTSYPPGLVDGDALGKANARVDLDVWSDFQCPFCGQFARTYIPRLVDDFVVPGQLRITSHDIAILGRGSPNESLDAAVAATCAGAQNKYWQYHDLLFWNQRGENEGAFSRDRLAAMAQKLSLDMAAWNACFADPSQATAVNATTQRAVAAGINSTPTVVLDGQRSAGLPRTYEDLASAIRARLGDASSSTPSASQ
jgi:protein-disulfide isomerase